MDERSNREVVDQILGDISSKMEEGGQKSEPQEKESLKREEITLKFGKGLVGEEFQGKDGKLYCEILIPNQDKEDKRPWQTFVLNAKQVHENQYGKGMWCKLPADGQTTIQRRVKVGQDEHGKNIWQTQKRKIPNTELKQLVEAYRQRVSMKNKLAEKTAEASQYNAQNKSQEKTKSRENSL